MSGFVSEGMMSASTMLAGALLLMILIRASVLLASGLIS